MNNKSIQDLLLERFKKEGLPRKGIFQKNLYSNTTYLPLICKNPECCSGSKVLASEDLKIYLTVAKRSKPRTQQTIKDIINEDTTTIIIKCKHCGEVLYKFMNFKDDAGSTTTNNQQFNLTNKLYDVTNIFKITSNFLPISYSEEKDSFKILPTKANFTFSLAEDFWKYLRPTNDTTISFDVYIEKDAILTMNFLNYPLENQANSKQVFENLKFTSSLEGGAWHTLTINSDNCTKVKLRTKSGTIPVFTPKINLTINDFEIGPEAIYITNFTRKRPSEEVATKISTFYSDAEIIFESIEVQAENNKAILDYLGLLSTYSNTLSAPMELDYKYVFDYRKETDANVKMYKNTCELFGTIECPSSIEAARALDEERYINAILESQASASVQEQLYKEKAIEVRAPQVPEDGSSLDLINAYKAVLEDQEKNLELASETYPPKIRYADSSTINYSNKRYSCVQCMNALGQNYSQSVCSFCNKHFSEEHCPDIEACSISKALGLNITFYNGLDDLRGIIGPEQYNSKASYIVTANDLVFKEKLDQKIVCDSTLDRIKVEKKSDEKLETVSFDFKPTTGIKLVMKTKLLTKVTNDVSDGYPHYALPIAFIDKIYEQDFKKLVIEANIYKPNFKTNQEATVNLKLYSVAMYTSENFNEPIASCSVTNEKSEIALVADDFTKFTSNKSFTKMILAVQAEDDCIIEIKNIYYMDSNDKNNTLGFSLYEPSSEVNGITLLADGDLYKDIIVDKASSEVNSTIKNNLLSGATDNELDITFDLGREYKADDISNIFIYLKNSAQNAKYFYGSNIELSTSSEGGLVRVSIPVTYISGKFRDLCLKVQAQDAFQLDLCKVELVTLEKTKPSGYYFNNDFSDKYYPSYTVQEKGLFKEYKQVGWSLVDSIDPDFPVYHTERPIKNDVTLYAVWEGGIRIKKRESLK